MKKIKGITLISLVVTIIVLIILAGVSISMLMGENGIITRAIQAKDTYENAIKQEKINIGDLSDFKIAKVSNAIKGKDISSLPTKETYVGDFIKISSEDLKVLNLDFEGDYYVNTITGEVYDINGDSYNDITYHSEEELRQILYCDEDVNIKRLLKMKYKQLDYLKNNQQHSNGAIATYTRTGSNSSYSIVPYFACSASIDMLADIGSFDNIRRYIIWHFEHINTQKDIDGIVGTIYDYKYEGDTVTTENKYDSVDSYCSLFIDLLYKYANRTGDTQLLIDNKDKIDLVVEALDSMYREDIHLTKTKESYNISYLMDNTESFARI